MKATCENCGGDSFYADATRQVNEQGTVNLIAVTISEDGRLEYEVGSNFDTYDAYYEPIELTECIPICLNCEGRDLVPDSESTLEEGDPVILKADN